MGTTTTTTTPESRQNEYVSRKTLPPSLVAPTITPASTSIHTKTYRHVLTYLQQRVRVRLVNATTRRTLCADVAVVDPSTSRSTPAHPADTLLRRLGNTTGARRPSVGRPLVPAA